MCASMQGTCKLRNSRVCHLVGNEHMRERKMRKLKNSQVITQSDEQMCDEDQL